MNTDAPVAEQEAPAKPKKERVSKPDFDNMTAIDSEGNSISLDGDGKLSGLPANWSPKFGRLSKTSFTSSAFFLEWRAYLCDVKAFKATEEARELRSEAEIERKGGDPNAKKAKKVQKLKAALAKLEAELEECGVSV